MTWLDSGYVTIEHCCSPLECDEIAKQLNFVYLVGSRCFLQQSWCQALAALLRIRLATTIPEIQPTVAVQCTYFNKTASRNWLVAWHQDRSIPVAPAATLHQWPGFSTKEGMFFIHGSDSLLKQMIVVRLHIDTTTIDRGPLRVIPGSHAYGTLSSEQIGDIRASAVEKAIAIDKGGVLAMRPLILHASSKSKSLSPRRVLHFVFGPRELPDGLRWG
ncbi:phytanoyl-CoA dioxygenase family protein [Romeria aff. gracilis LEGE 07310]|uniref:Phytanoyl-CoA dioxygenase family protein n=1 Tax=Vasconcelosia minhoensis LEGE 07310 TaxID=915328 RepID=A0A8J7AAX2_9CYAN|nr:phytanoyl-CoA dioxygenase family protein [Romeria gracilis]MBE9079465.1 phytanoyl-CoA dioxygenase family protein [Romeria aff. gracilis LEGE 07310]